MLLTMSQFGQRARNNKTGGTGISNARVAALVASGVIQSQRFGRMVLIPSTELAKWNRGRRRDGRPPNKVVQKRRRRC